MIERVRRFFMYSIAYMKKLQEERGPILNGFSDKQDIIQHFDIKDKTFLDDAHILMAIYENEWYEGDAFVLYIKDDQIYEVNGSHCSCYGLEDQWDPDIVLLAELEANRFKESYRFESIPNIRQTLEKVIGVGQSDPKPYEPVDTITDLELN